MYIAEHVHLRDKEQDYKETIRHGLEVAKKAGVDAVFDVVNTENPVTTRERVIERLEFADRCNSDVFYGLYILMTENPKQIEESIKVYHEFFPKPGNKLGVIGQKMLVDTVGISNLRKPWKQRQVYEIDSKNGYGGVLAVHAVDVSLMKPELWNPQNPITHCYARPVEAKVKGIQNQVKFALETNFQGKIHIFHVSSPEEVDYINSIRYHLSPGANETASINISCQVTPHHLFLFDELMNEKDGLLLKVNPALRPRKTAEGLLQCLKEDKIDTIATDHAPHSRKEKLEYPYLSGIPGLDLWPRVVKRLRKEGFSEEQISALTFDNQIKLFGLEGVIKKSNNPGDENLNEYPHLRPEGLLEWI